VLSDKSEKETAKLVPCRLFSLLFNQNEGGTNGAKADF
jgi:hypothetical protein